MTRSVLSPLSSNVTVVTGPSPLSSLVQTTRECGVTSRYRPKNAIGPESCAKTRRYWPPVRMSASKESTVIPNDFGIHHCRNRSGLVHASNTRRAGPLTFRVTTSSRSDVRSIVVLLPFVVSINHLLPFQFLDTFVPLVDPCVPELAVPIEPGRLFLQTARAKLAGPYAPNLLRGHEPGLLQNADVLLHARERHVELLGQSRDRSVGVPELLENAASGGIRERGERSIQLGMRRLNHAVQYLTHASIARKRRPPTQITIVS